MAFKNSELNTSGDYLKKGSFVLIISVILGFVADYGFNLTLSQSLTSHEYGDYKVAYAFATISSVLILLGGDRVAPRLLSTGLANKDNTDVWEFLRFYLIIALSLSSLVIITTYILSVLHIGSTDLQEHHPLVLISFAIPLIAFGALLSRILQSAKHLALANLPWRIMLPVLKISLIILFIFLLNTIALWQVILTGVLSVIIVISFQWYKIRQLNLIELKRSPHFINSAQTLQLSIPMMLAMLVTMAVNQIDLFMLELFAKEHEVGHFAAATTTAHIIPIAQVTIVGLFLPLISPAIKQGYQSAKSLFWQGQKVIMISTSLIAITLLVAGEKLLSLFGPDYSQAIQTLWLLICGYLIWSFAAFSSTWLQYDDKGFWVVIVGIVTLILDGSLNFALIPLYGIKGAAMATTISLSLAALCICLFRYKHSKEN